MFPCRLYGCWWWTNGEINFGNSLGWLAWLIQTQNTCITHIHIERENKNKIHKFNDDVLNTNNTDFFLVKNSNKWYDDDGNSGSKWDKRRKLIDYFHMEKK